MPVPLWPLTVWIFSHFISVGGRHFFLKSMHNSPYAWEGKNSVFSVLRFFFIYFIFCNSSELSCHLFWCAATLWFQASSCHIATPPLPRQKNKTKNTTTREFWLFVSADSHSRVRGCINCRRSRSRHEWARRVCPPGELNDLWGLMAQCSREKQQQCVSAGECHTVPEDVSRAAAIYLPVFFIFADAGSANKPCTLFKCNAYIYPLQGY